MIHVKAKALEELVRDIFRKAGCSAAEAERISNEASDILEQAELSAYRDQAGKPAGVRLDHVEQGSLILDRGFQEGDILQKINGQPINSKTELVDWVQRNQDKYSMYRVQIQRRGQSKTLSFRVQNPPQ